MVLVPVTLLLVVALLLWNTGSLARTAMVLTAVPLSLVGAVWMLVLLDLHLSVAVWVGMIALAGLDAETGVVMLLYLRLAVDRARAAAPGGTLSPGALDSLSIKASMKLSFIHACSSATSPSAFVHLLDEVRLEVGVRRSRRLRRVNERGPTQAFRVGPAPP